VDDDVKHLEVLNGGVGDIKDGDARDYENCKKVAFILIKLKY